MPCATAGVRLERFTSLSYQDANIQTCRPHAYNAILTADSHNTIQSVGIIGAGTGKLQALGDVQTHIKDNKLLQ